ncbi:MAG TPA: hypothetical protein VET85_11905, partial [Stellaceae bacterium]|nr:hypothetical protein [Stellaceae bacterium]
AGRTGVRLSLPAQFLARITPVLAAFGFMPSRRAAAPKKGRLPAPAPVSPAETSAVVEITVPHDIAETVAPVPQAPPAEAPAPAAAPPVAAAPVASEASWPAPQETVTAPAPPAPIRDAFPPPPAAAAMDQAAERIVARPLADSVARAAPIVDAAVARIEAGTPAPAPAAAPTVRLTLPSVVVPPVASAPAHFGSFARPAAPVIAPEDQPAPVVVPAPAAVALEPSEAAVPAQEPSSEIAPPAAPQPMQAATPRFVVEIPVIAEDVPALSIEKLAAEAGDLARRMLSPSLTPEASPFAALHSASDAPARTEPVARQRAAEERVVEERSERIVEDRFVEDRAAARRAAEKPVADEPGLRQPGAQRRVVPGTAYDEHAFDAAPYEEPVAAARAPKPRPKPTAERPDGHDMPAEEPVLDPEQAAEKEALLADLGAAIDNVMSKRWYGTGGGALQAVFAPPGAVATQIVSQSTLLEELASQAVSPAIPEKLKESGRLGTAFFYGCLCLCGAIVGYAFWQGPLPITQTIQEFMRLF